jgi:hypothetical protein
MKTTYKWILAGGITISGLLLLLFANLYYGRFWIGRYPIIEGHGIMRNGFSHASSASGSLFGWLALALVVFLLIMGGIWLSGRNSKSPEITPSERNPDEPLICPSCGLDVQANWNLCPYCGNELPVP